MQGATHRIKYLDGLRGIAIVLVILTHYWGLGWTEILPFGKKFGAIRPIEQGWVGVELFFLISGFVILLTLERCATLAQFIYKRWLRLFPAMAIVTILTVIFNYSIQPIPQFSNSPLHNAIPGLVFISPSFFHAIFHIEIDSLHRSFWTLYVEVGFYAIFGASFLKFGWVRSTFALCVLGIATLYGKSLLILAGVSGLPLRIVEPFAWLGMKYYLWFASGILFAKAATLKSNRIFVMACAVGLIAALLVSPNELDLKWHDSQAMIAALVLFAVAQKWALLQRLLQSRPVWFIGIISYPLYLIHETIGLGLIVLTDRAVPGIPSALLPMPTLALMILCAYAIAKYGEPRFRALFGRIATGQGKSAEIA